MTLLFLTLPWLLSILALRGVRWAYVLYVVVGLLYFPVSVGFQFNPRACQFAFSLPLAVLSLTNFAHVVLFAFFFVVTSAQFSMKTPAVYVCVAAMTVAMGILVEVAQSVTGNGNCRVRDLVPDSAGAAIGGTIVFVWRRSHRQRIQAI
jgi:hypothetical protein